MGESRNGIAPMGDRIKLLSVDHFDYVIVGAGTAGCVLADRLSASGRDRVLVLEAGGSDARFWIKTPIGYGFTFADAAVNWKYQCSPSPGLNGRSMYWPRGRVIGGSSSINAMVYCRGMPADFDDWRDLGNDGWGWGAPAHCAFPWIHIANSNRHSFAISRRISPEFCCKPPALFHERAQGMPGARCAR